MWCLMEARTSARLIFNLYSICTSLVAKKICICGETASLSASSARSISPSTQRASPVTEQCLIAFAMALTHSKSPGEEIGKPASITSIPSFSSCKAIWIFSFTSKLTPGVCSPSLSVVSKNWIFFIRFHLLFYIR